MRAGIGDDAERAWTAAEAAEDLVAQMEELLGDGIVPTALASALEVEGLERQTAQAVVFDVAGRSATAALDAAATTCGIDLVHLRRFLRKPGIRLEIDDAAVAKMHAALVKQGLRPATAAAAVAELASGERRFAEVHLRRMRRLGVQGMLAGGAFTAFFAWSALVGPGGAWNLLTAGMTLAMAAYSGVLYARNRPEG